MIRSAAINVFIATLGCICCLMQSASAITIRNTSLEFANHGMCSAAFVIDSGLEEMSDVKIYFDALNEKADLVDNGAFMIDHFGYSAASRIEIVSLENEELCYETLSLKINKATAVIDGKVVNLLQTDNVHIQQFEPMTIIISND